MNPEPCAMLWFFCALQALQRIAEDIKGVPIDVVLYVDRLDLYRVEPLDKRVSQLVI